MFRVDVDETIIGGELVLNGNAARLMKNVDGAYWAKWTGGDASGEIIIRYPDKKSAVCRIGYVTSGMDIREFVVRHRICEQML
ncbi:hypothetical protein M2337_001531 [Sphingobium sp. B2D3A]|uniref:hypothetical protein n=1 Tax=unclassified Sphingobium TaxID=2611147 RepID=UPI002224B109|nr:MULTISPECIES: hypothetical protein [unclassified Sphingobium]MCW2337298.1 hypothetical protein [Sphingobium sp. B2D3A]MCW2383756.1 hypothetical protein [Sphingobium sp. B2D3D]